MHFFVLSANTGAHRCIYWAKNWCWLSSWIHLMVETDTVVKAANHITLKYEDADEYERKNGLGIQLYKVIKTVADGDFTDILWTENKNDINKYNTVSLEKLYERMINDNLIPKGQKGKPQDAASKYQELISKLITKYPSLESILRKCQIQSVWINKLINYQTQLSLSFPLKNESALKGSEVVKYFYGDYFFIRIDAKSHSMPRIIYDLPQSTHSSNQNNSNYEALGFCLMDSGDVHYTSIVKSKNGEWYFYDGVTKKLINNKDINDLLTTNKYQYKTSSTSAPTEYKINSILYKKIPNFIETLSHLLHTLKQKLLTLLIEIQKITHK